MICEAGAATPFVIHHQGPQFGVVTTGNYNQFRPGKRYEIKIVHLATNAETPDYDFTAMVTPVSIPAGVICEIEDPEWILRIGYWNQHEEPPPWITFYAEGKKAYVNLIKAEITEPDGNPVTDNHFVFDSTGSGICNVTATGTTGVSEKDVDLEWLLTAIADSDQTNYPTPPKGSNITFTYTGLPVSNSQFGVKTLTLTYPPASQQDTQAVEIFFNKMATNNPDRMTPNWYYYWSQTGASSGNHEYNTSLGYDGQYTCGDNHFEIGPSSCGQDYGLAVKGDGIDNFGSTCLHEKAHMDYFLTTWGTWANYLSRQPAEDIDGDGLKDSEETSLTGLDGQPYDPTKKDTNGDSYDDGEDWACKSENTWQIGTHDSEDWSSPGHQTNN